MRCSSCENFKEKVGRDMLVFTWPLVPGAHGYRLYCDDLDTLVCQVGRHQGNLGIPMPTDGKQHTYFLTSFIGSLESSPATVVANPKPIQPCNLRVEVKR